MIYGGRISLTIGLIGVAVSFVIGITIGGLAGYYGGWVDNVVNRVIEIFQSFPQLPLWMALSAAFAGELEPAADLFRHQRSSWAWSTGPDWRGRSDRSSWPCARRNFCVAAELMGAGPGESSAATCCPAS